MTPERGRTILAIATEQALTISDDELVRLQLEVDNDVRPTQDALQALGLLAFEAGMRLSEQQAEV